jgi:hypothetical protein
MKNQYSFKIQEDTEIKLLGTQKELIIENYFSRKSDDTVPVENLPFLSIGCTETRRRSMMPAARGLVSSLLERIRSQGIK